MALVRAERVLETSTTTGTGSLTLGGPVTGYRSFASVMSTSDTCYYAIVAVDSSGRPTGAWETGLGTLTGATTFTRTTVLASSNGGALVNLTSGTKQVFLTLTSTEIVNIVADIASKASATKVDVYSSNDTWTRPDGAKFVDVICVSGGNGGNSGALAANLTTSSVDASGGLGGTFGGLAARFFIPADALTPTVSITVGAGGAGGAARTTTGSSNGGGTAGGSSFGSYVTVSNSNSGTSGGNGGGVVDGVAANGNVGQIPALYRPVLALNYTSDASAVSYTSVANAATGGTAGTAANTNNATATGGNGGNGTTLTGASAGQISSGGGGGGGAGVISAGAATACIGGDGGNGGFPGGGGGGGGGAGAVRNSLPTGSRSGKGGDGGSGAVVVITRF